MRSEANIHSTWIITKYEIWRSTEFFMLERHRGTASVAGNIFTQVLIQFKSPGELRGGRKRISEVGSANLCTFREEQR